MVNSGKIADLWLLIYQREEIYFKTDQYSSRQQLQLFCSTFEGDEAQRMSEDDNRKSVPSDKHEEHDHDEKKEKILSVPLRNMVMIDGKVYGLEDNSEPDAFVDCASKISLCRAGCCSYVFALTQ
jgi:hypothetical protein